MATVPAMVELRFNSGSVDIRGLRQGSTSLPSVCRWDQRTASYRCFAQHYAAVIRSLRARGETYRDLARRYDTFAEPLRLQRSPRPYQSAALQAWLREDMRGIVVLPTGAGKSHLALMSIQATRRDTLVVAPTLDLVRQWYDTLSLAFDTPIGIVGGGEHTVSPLTVATYDSAYLHMEHLGNRFGLVVFDECHHLPSEAYTLAARQCMAPFRLGLSATPERSDGRHGLLGDLVGPTVYRQDIVDLSGSYLAEYDTIRLSVSLSEEERAAYQQARNVYRAFIKRHKLRVAAPGGWSEFIRRAARSEEGVQALAAHRRQRRLAFAATAKLQCLEQLLFRHRRDRMLIFTDDTSTTYEISRRFLLPAITHQTKVSERSRILARLVDGTYGAIVTARVLNEGVDLPAANVAVVVSGSGSVREHVQRLGRVLRPQTGKRALLYELVSSDTAEAFTSELRRDHVAYQ